VLDLSIATHLRGYLSAPVLPTVTYRGYPEEGGPPIAQLRINVDRPSGPGRFGF
jgi:hypothetical protein